MFIVKAITNRILQVWKYTGGLFALIFFSVRDYLFERKGRHLVHSIITSQIYFTGNKAITIISTVAFTLGAITVIQLFSRLSSVGAVEYMGVILNVVIIRELGPLITAFVVIARSGSAISAEIATMMVTDEISAIEMQGINTLKIIVFPRIAGVTISLIMLSIYFITLGLTGAFIIGNLYSGLTFDTFQKYMLNSIGFLDILASIMKSAVFGLFIAAIPIYYGFQAFTYTQIPQVTTKAVVSSIFTLFVLDILITLMFSL
ncbi:MAG: ABC transporter permease [Leptospirales bacterium]